MSAAVAIAHNLIPDAEGGVWNQVQLRATLRRLWLPICLSTAAHVLLIAWLHGVLLHDRTGQSEPGLQQGLNVTLLDSSSEESQTAAPFNAATALSNAALPGHARDVAEQSSQTEQPAVMPAQPAQTVAPPMHPQRIADGSAPISEAARTSADANATRPKASTGAKGSFDSGYMPSTAVDRAPIPLIQPNLELFSHLQRPRAPIQLRAYVTQSGVVDQIVVVASQPEDQAAADAIAKAYKDVVYIAASNHGKPVASKIDFTVMLMSSLQPGDRPESPVIRGSHP